MALTVIDPFTEVTYIGQVREFVRWASTRVEETELGGHRSWHDHLVNYTWAGENWLGSVNRRLEAGHALRTAHDTAGLKAVANGIMVWGGMGAFDDDQIQAIADSFVILDRTPAGGTGWHDLYVDRLPSVSKVYQAYDSANWVIYDSRVGYALASLVNEWWSVTGDSACEGLLRFPTPPAQRKGARQVEGFPQLRQGARHQARLAFYFASWVVREIGVELNRRRAPHPDGRWETVHVEMVLFMLGGPANLPKQLAGTSKRSGAVVDPVTASAAKGVAKKAVSSVAAGEIADRAKDAAVAQALEARERFYSKQRALKFAEQTGGKLAQLQFADGKERWVVFTGKPLRPIASFPGFDGDLSDALQHHVRPRLRTTRFVRSTLPASRAKKVVTQTRSRLTISRNKKQQHLPETAE